MTNSKLHLSITKLTKLLLLLIASIYIMLFLYIALKRIGYPYELEWMEGGAVDHVRRLLLGNPLYIKPSLEFTPFIYPPLYFYLSAGLSAILGLGFLPLRLLSILSTIGIFIIIFLFVFKDTHDIVFSGLAVSLFAATFMIGGAWFDLARVDMLFLFLTLCAAYMLWRKQNKKSAFLSGILIFLAFLTKQTALAAGIALSLFAIITMKKWSKLIFPLTSLGLIGLSTILFDLQSKGWYSYYIFELPNQHIIHKDIIPQILINEIATQLPIVVLLAAIYPIQLLLSKKYLDFLFTGLTFGAIIGSSILSRMHSGGYINALIPLYASLAILFGLSLYSIQILLKRYLKSSILITGIEIIVLLACGYQFWNLTYDYKSQIPSNEDILYGDQLIATMQDIEGDIFVPFHGYLPSLAEKNTYAQGMALEDIFRSTDETIRDELKSEIREAIQTKQFSAIILDSEWRFANEIEQNYEYKGYIFEDEDVFWSLTGMKTRPQMLYIVR